MDKIAIVSVKFDSGMASETMHYFVIIPPSNGAPWVFGCRHHEAG